MTRARDVANLIGSGNYSSTTFTATAGQTAFTISHTQGFVQVFMNGLLLDETADYTSCLLYTSPSPRDVEESRMPSSA